MPSYKFSKNGRRYLHYTWRELREFDNSMWNSALRPKYVRYLRNMQKKGHTHPWAVLLLLKKYKKQWDYKKGIARARRNRVKASKIRAMRARF